jgi:predicted GTPase
MGYGERQTRDLEATINAVDCDLVLASTPVDLNRLLSINKPTLRVRYEYKDYGSPRLEEILVRRLTESGIL